jgi:hypothetical protein
VDLGGKLINVYACSSLVDALRWLFFSPLSSLPARRTHQRYASTFDMRVIGGRVPFHSQTQQTLASLVVAAETAELAAQGRRPCCTSARAHPSCDRSRSMCCTSEFLFGVRPLPVARPITLHLPVVIHLQSLVRNF